MAVLDLVARGGSVTDKQLGEAVGLIDMIQAEVRPPAAPARRKVDKNTGSGDAASCEEAPQAAGSAGGL
jgi:hypothetical protein